MQNTIVQLKAPGNQNEAVLSDGAVVLKGTQTTFALRANFVGGVRILQRCGSDWFLEKRLAPLQTPLELLVPQQLFPELVRVLGRHIALFNDLDSHHASASLQRHSSHDSILYTEMLSDHSQTQSSDRLHELRTSLALLLETCRNSTEDICRPMEPQITLALHALQIDWDVFYSALEMYVLDHSYEMAFYAVSLITRENNVRFQNIIYNCKNLTMVRRF